MTFINSLQKKTPFGNIARHYSEPNRPGSSTSVEPAYSSSSTFTSRVFLGVVFLSFCGCRKRVVAASQGRDYDLFITVVAFNVRFRTNVPLCPCRRRSGRPPPSRSLSWTRLHPSGSWRKAGEKKRE